MKQLEKEMHELDKFMRVKGQKLLSETENMVYNSFSPDVLKRGLRLSKAATAQPGEVAMTPLLKNALDKYDKGKRLMVNDPVTNAEIKINEAVIKLLNKWHGTKIVEYDTTLECDDSVHYNVDCWRNWKENNRDIQPGQEQQRFKNIQGYLTRPKEIKIDYLSAIWQLAIKTVASKIPFVSSTTKIKDISIPFMRKHTNVSFPYFHNDKAVDPKTKKTYGQLTLDIASSIGDDFDKLYMYNVSTLYGRNQRGKGRHIIAVSRIINLVLNRLESQEIEAYKHTSPLFVGYNDTESLKHVLVRNIKFAKQYGLTMSNWDQSKYDFHVTPMFLKLASALSLYKTKDRVGKDIAKHRYALSTNTKILANKIRPLETIYGRIFSGFIDTNRGGGLINALVTTYCMMLADENYSWIANTAPSYMAVMGDDNLFIHKKDLDRNKFKGEMNKLGFEVHHDKGEYGCFFLQNRVFLDKETKEYKITYPWTRVVRSMLYKETGKNLGPAGWTLAFWQQLSKLTEHFPALYCAMSIVLPLDREQLMLDKSIDDIIKLVQEEDKLAGRLTTANRLNDGDPQKTSMFKIDSNGNAQFDNSYLRKLQNRLREVRDTLIARNELSNL